MKFTRCQNVDCNKEYDFNDLIDVAVKAVSGEIIEGYEVGKTDKGLYISFVCDFGMSVKYFKCDWREAVLFIESIYTETFIIENNHDLMKALKGDNGILANGEKFSVLSDAYSYTNKDKLMILVNNEKLHVTFPILKGAKVTQKRNL